MTGGIVVHLIGYFISAGSITDEVYVNMGGSAKVILALYPNIGFWWGVKTLMTLENNNVGAHWDNLFSQTLPGDPITMGTVWILLLADVFIFAGLTWYMDSIKPGPYGVAQKWYFIFKV